MRILDASFHPLGVKREIVCKIVISVNTLVAEAGACSESECGDLNWGSY